MKRRPTRAIPFWKESMLFRATSPLAIAALFLLVACIVRAAVSETSQPVRADSPYDNNATWNLLRGQLHCHNIQDINKHPQITLRASVFAQQWKDAGFDFVVLTNHYRISSPLERSPVIWGGRSVELTPDPLTRGCPRKWFNQPHVLGIDMDEGVHIKELWKGVRFFADPVSSIKCRVLNIHKRHGLAMVAHPDARGWHGWKYHNFYVSVNRLLDLYTLDPIYRPDGIAIYGSGGRGHSAELKWDKLLAKGGGRIKVWGFAEEDFHPLQGYTMGKAWVAVPGAPTDTWATVKEKLRTGNYYSYWVKSGPWPALSPVPRLKVTVDDSGSHPTIRAELQSVDGSPYSVDTIQFIGCSGGIGGKTLHETNGSNASYQCRGDEIYVRARVVHRTSGGMTLNIASQPVTVKAGSA